ncbi:MAG: hypothetical protein ACREYF_16200 [Gammaproteobacteria bacterium]
MHSQLATDAARVLAALHDERAWFRHGLTDHRIVELTGLAIDRVVTARWQAQHDGLIERVSRVGDTINMLTPLGVARAHAMRA